MSAPRSIPPGSISRHPPHGQLPLAMIIAILLSPSVLAADYSAPLHLDAGNVSTINLDQKSIEVTDPSPAVTLQGADFSLHDVMLRNSVGAGVDVGNAARLSAQGLEATTLADQAVTLQVGTQGWAQLSAGSSLHTSGSRSPATTVANGELHISDSRLQTLGVLSPGIDIGSNGVVNVERSQIETFEMTSSGIRDSNNALAGEVHDSSIHTHQAESAGVQVYQSPGLLTLENTQVLTEAGASDGVSALDDSHVALTHGSAVHTLGALAPALNAGRASTIEMSDGQVLSEGRGSAGARASGASRIRLLRSQVLVAGSQAAGLVIEDDSRIHAIDSAIGNVDGSTAIFTRNQAAAAGQLELDHSSLTGPSVLVEVQTGSAGVATFTDSQLLAAQGGAFLIASGSQLQTSLSGSKVDAAQLATVKGDGQLDLTASGSMLAGDTRLQNPGSGRLDMTLDDSHWQFSAGSSLGNLSLDRSTVFFAGNGYQVLTVHGDLGGNGRFLMKTDLSASQGDLLSVEGQVNGQHELLIADSGRDANGAPLKVVGSAGGAGQFNLYGGHVDAGAFRYGLQRQGNDWYLAEVGQLAPMTALTPSMTAQSVPVPNAVAMTALTPSMTAQSVPVPNAVAMTALTPSMTAQSVPVPNAVAMTALTPSMTAQSVPVPNAVAMTALTPSMTAQSTPIPSALPMSALSPAMSVSQPQRLSKGANAALGMQDAAANLWQSEMGTLTRRLGELRQGNDQGGLWARAMGSRLDVDSGYSRAFEQRVSGSQIGADGALQQGDATLYLGAMVGLGHSDQDFGEQASGQIDSQSVGFYATYMREDGWYLDSVVKYDHLQGDVKINNNLGGRVRGDYDADAYGASVELGRQIPLGEGWFVEPQVQVAAAHIEGPQYTSTDGLKVHADAVDSVQARAGGRVGRNLLLESGAQVQGYLSADWIDELAGDSEVAVNGHTLDNQLPGAHGELGAGAAVLVEARHKVSVEAHYGNGHEIEQPLSITVGYRYLW